MASSPRQTIESVVQNFGGRVLNKAGEIEWFDSHRTATCDAKALRHGRSLRAVYLAAARPAIAGANDGENLFLKNADRMGGGWNQPMIDTYVRRHLIGPDVSFSALRTALQSMDSDPAWIVDNPFTIEAMTAENIVDWSEGTEPIVYLNPETHEFFEVTWAENGTDDEQMVAWPKPAQGLFVSMQYPGSSPRSVPEDFIKGYWHVAEGVLLRVDDKFLLGGLDEGRYFLSLLAQPAQTVAEAYEGLKPAKVREAEQAGREVRRQGEWFFVKSSIDRAGVMRLGNVGRAKEFEQLTRLSPLVGNSRADGNQHICHHLPINVDGNIVQMATGLVRHQRLNRWTGQRRQTNEHRPVDLGEAWWEVYENTALRSWSVGGNFD